MGTHHEGEKTVVLGIFNDALAANQAQDKLKEAGIKSFLQDENVVGLNPMGGIEVKVFSKDVEQAKKIITQSR